jgi:hypothetical protein
VLGGVVSSVGIPLTKLAAATVEMPLAKLQGRTATATYGDAIAGAKGYTRAASLAVDEFMKTWRTGISTQELRDTRTRYLSQLPDISKPLVTISDKITGGNRVARNVVKMADVNNPLKLLGATDDMFRTLLRGAYTASEANRFARLTGKNATDIALNLADHPEMFEKISRDVERAVLQAPLTGLAKLVQQSRSNPMSGALIPFFQTTANITRIGLLDLGPAGLKRAHRYASEAAGSTGEAKTALQGRSADALGEAIVGSVLMGATAQQVMEGNVSGAGPDDPNVRDEMSRQGWMPYAVQINGGWYPYLNILGPAGIAMGLAANIAEAKRHGENKEKGETEALTKFIKDFANMSFSQAGLRTWSDLIKSAANQSWGTFNEGIATTMVPLGGMLANIARITDTEIKDPEGAIEAIMGRLPGLSHNVRPKLDVFGQPLRRQMLAPVDAGGGTIDLGQLFPVRTTQGTSDPVLTEYQRLRDQGFTITIGTAPTTIQGIKLQPDEQAAYQELLGRWMKEELGTKIDSKEYQSAIPSVRAYMLQQQETKTRAKAEDRFSVWMRDRFKADPVMAQKRAAEVMQNRLRQGQTPYASR